MTTFMFWALAFLGVFCAREVFCACGCNIPQNWCHDTSSLIREYDCNGDGYIDSICSNASGDRGVISYSNECVDTFPNSNIADCHAMFDCKNIIYSWKSNNDCEINGSRVHNPYPENNGPNGFCFTYSEQYFDLREARDLIVRFQPLNDKIDGVFDHTMEIFDSFDGNVLIKIENVWDITQMTIQGQKPVVFSSGIIGNYWDFFYDSTSHELKFFIDYNLIASWNRINDLNDAHKLYFRSGVAYSGTWNILPVNCEAFYYNFRCESIDASWRSPPYPSSCEVSGTDFWNPYTSNQNSGVDGYCFQFPDTHMNLNSREGKDQTFRVQPLDQSDRGDIRDVVLYIYADGESNRIIDIEDVFNHHRWSQNGVAHAFTIETETDFFWDFIYRAREEKLYFYINYSLQAVWQRSTDLQNANTLHFKAGVVYSGKWRIAELSCDESYSYANCKTPVPSTTWKVIDNHGDSACLLGVDDNTFENPNYLGKGVGISGYCHLFIDEKIDTSLQMDQLIRLRQLNRIDDVTHDHLISIYGGGVSSEFKKVQIDDVWDFSRWYMYPGINYVDFTRGELGLWDFYWSNSDSTLYFYINGQLIHGWSISDLGNPNELYFLGGVVYTGIWEIVHINDCATIISQLETLPSETFECPLEALNDQISTRVATSPYDDSEGVEETLLTELRQLAAAVAENSEKLNALMEKFDDSLPCISKHCNLEVSLADVLDINGERIPQFEGIYVFLEGETINNLPVYLNHQKNMYLYVAVSQYESITGWVLDDDPTKENFPYSVGYLHPSGHITSGEFLSGVWSVGKKDLKVQIDVRCVREIV